ncbi:ATP-dependent helicase [Phormidesmis priestleyi ULC007]|uniref:DNA 3'-5' helicase n=1 Tax=Phormidesmis priestleyi ULC007 TaxID=1920490 RepID=A0A2T1D4N7_9CYAN|nr:ATP-dependent helicase [Phormidesmis priestleyi]PSB15396.1 ATP-dependent helicase [Phormidesmis priestleyi ULC007]PZO46086.1 MAG: ATP-dependent helicase [Phormidesmis priestleyi]
MLVDRSPSNLTSREPLLKILRDGLRPGQQEIADWQGGRLAVSAVPGAGKSTGMAVAAALAIARHQLHTKRQLVVVTFTRSAAANIKSKIRDYLKTLMLPQGGFVVHTLHGLAWSIARSYPELSGLNPDSVLITPNQSHRLIRNSVEQWIGLNPSLYQQLLEGRQFDGEETERLRRQAVLRTEVLPALADTVIREAKSSGLMPQDLRDQSYQVADGSILTIAAGLYEQYQLQLKSRNSIDYDEMVLGALRVLENPSVRSRWQTQVFAVFEDEAQDSSPLQTQLLELLATDPNHAENHQNLVRVGDPNQAINSTFTPADPVFFRQFCQQCSDDDRLAEMNQAGRSSPVIIDAANFVLTWVNRHYSKVSTDEALTESATPFRSQAIHPVAFDDPQTDANPLPIGLGLEIYTPEDVYKTVELIGQRSLTLFTEDSNAQAAVLVRTNEQGRFVTRELKRWHGEDLNVFEVGQRDRQSHIPAEILSLLQFLDRPHSPDHLKAALLVLVGRRLIPTQDLNALVTFPEQFLYPAPLDPPQSPQVREASHYCVSLLRARLELPLYQLISFLAYTLNYDQTELATANKLSERIMQQTTENSLGAMLETLSEIVNSEKFEPVEAEDDDRYTRPSQLTVITMHKAKGLDWDTVFIPFLHENMIPGSLYVPPQAKFLGDFTLSEVARAQIRAIVHENLIPDIETAWKRAEYLKTAEEFRLLYVAMTRAKRLLWMSAAKRAPFSWNKSENLDDRKPCPLIPALKAQFPGSVIDDDVEF